MELINTFEININFIVVDDDSVNNLIYRKVIRHLFPKADVVTFTNPETALTYIKSTYANSSGNETILLLDLNMPILSGWDFLEVFEDFDANIKGQVKIYILSSSIDQNDKDCAANNKNISGYIEKPLTKENIGKVVFQFLRA